MSDTDQKISKLTERFEQHLHHFEQHKKDEDCKFDKLIDAQQVNTESINQLASSVNTLTKDTGEIVNLYRDFQGTIRLGKSVQSFMLWCLKWGMIGTGAVAIIERLIKYFSE